MKNILIAAFALTGPLAFGSHTVCSSPTLYYSSVRHDFGTQPPPGKELGKLTIVNQGKVLVNYTQIQGEGQYAIPEYLVALEGPREVILKTGNQVFGSTVYKAVAVLRTAPPQAEEEIARSAVICETTWAMVP